MLFCLGAQAAEKRNLDDIRNALWQDSDDVSLREMPAALGEAGENRSAAIQPRFEMIAFVLIGGTVYAGCKEGR